MGKVSPTERGAKTPKQKRRLRNTSSRYLKPGVLVQQLQYHKVLTAKSSADLGKKKVAALDAKKVEDDELVTESKGLGETPLMLSPVDLLKHTPRTPGGEDRESDLRLEALPIDLLVKILCHLHHDQLRPVFHVSRKIRSAVVMARQFYFNYTTPDRSRQELLQAMTPRPTERCPFVSKGEGRDVLMPSPHTPKAPKHGPRPPSRMKIPELRQIAAVLFQDSAFSSRCVVPSVPLCKTLASNRVLFYENELCQAVTQNKLL